MEIGNLIMIYGYVYNKDILQLELLSNHRDWLGWWGPDKYSDNLNWTKYRVLWIALSITQIKNMSCSIPTLIHSVIGFFSCMHILNI